MIRTVIGVRQGRFRAVPQPEFAQMLEVSVRQLRRYERDQETIPPEVAQRAKQLRRFHAPKWRIPADWMRGMKPRGAGPAFGRN